MFFTSERQHARSCRYGRLTRRRRFPMLTPTRILPVLCLTAMLASAARAEAFCPNDQWGVLTAGMVGTSAGYAQIWADADLYHYGSRPTCFGYFTARASLSQAGGSCSTNTALTQHVPPDGSESVSAIETRYRNIRRVDEYGTEYRLRGTGWLGTSGKPGPATVLREPCRRMGEGAAWLTAALSPTDLPRDVAELGVPICMLAPELFADRTAATEQRKSPCDCDQPPHLPATSASNHDSRGASHRPLRLNQRQVRHGFGLRLIAASRQSCGDVPCRHDGPSNKCTRVLRGFRHTFEHVHATERRDTRTPSRASLRESPHSRPPTAPARRAHRLTHNRTDRSTPDDRWPLMRGSPEIRARHQVVRSRAFLQRS